MSGNTYDVIVIGSGITGLTACKQLRQSGLSVANIEPGMFGGLVININELDGKVEGSGAEFASTLMMDAADLGTETLPEAVTSIEQNGTTWTVTTDAGAHQARAVIVASGAKLKRLGIPGEAEFEYKGVAQCADCDGPMYQGKDVVVVGDGDSALQEALVLARFCRQVHLLSRPAEFGAQAHLVKAIAACDNVKVHYSVQAQAILGSDGVEKVQARNLLDNTSSEIECSGFFGFIGLEPCSDFVPATVQRDANGFLITDSSMQTPMKGLFAAGAVRAGYAGMLEHAIAEGLAAAQGAVKELRAQGARPRPF